MSNPHIDVARRILAELSQMAEHASLTGGLQGGQRSAVQAYNGALETLRGQGIVPEGMFEPLQAEEASYGTLAVQARLLLAILPDEGREQRRRRDRRDSDDEGLGAVVALAPFLDSEDLAQMVRERINEAAEVSDGILTALAPFLDSGDLGQLVRRRMRPPVPKAADAPEPPRPPEPPRAPEPPVPPHAPAPPQPSTHPQIVAIVHPVVREQEDREPETLEDLVAQLRRADLTIEDRQRIATRLAELSYEQSVHALE